MIIIKRIKKFKIVAFVIFIFLSMIIVLNVLKHNEYKAVSKDLYQGYILVSTDNQDITNEFRNKYIEFYRNKEYKRIYEALNKTEYEMVYDNQNNKIKVFDSLN